MVFLGLILRLFLAFSFEATGDMGGWIIGGKTGVEHKDYGFGLNPYDGTCKSCTNWPPLTYHYLTFARWSYLNLNFLSLTQWGFYKLLSVVFDTGIIVLIYLLSSKSNYKTRLALAGIYAFHPIALEISAYHGQRDSVWLFFALLAILFFTKKKYLFASLLLAVGTSFKIPLLFLLPLFFFKIPKLKTKFFFTVIFLISCFFLSLPEIYIYTKGVIKSNFFYKGWSGWWGFSGLILKIPILSSVNWFIRAFDSFQRILMYLSILGFGYYFSKKKTDLITACLGIVMIVYFFSPAFASQYLIWPLPFIVLLKNKYPKYFYFYSVYAAYFSFNFYGIFRISFLENILLTLPQNNIYYKIKGFSFPMDLGIPLWIFSFFFIKKIVHIKELKFKGLKTPWTSTKAILKKLNIVYE